LAGQPFCRLRGFVRGQEFRCALSYAGCASGAPCPTGIFIAPDFTRYRAVSHSVRQIFKRHTDLIEPLSLDEAYLDVTENKTGLPTATLWRARSGSKSARN
jgi:nucleotidyltransferase/DNA polymerase involved in DNA repair